MVATLGDPSSIGPQVAAASFLEFPFTDLSVHVVGSRSALLNYMKEDRLQRLEAEESLILHDIEEAALYTPGKPGKESGARALADLKYAVELIQDRNLSALVTGPVDKYVCSLTEPQFSGQTEFLMKLSKAEGVTMVLSGPHLTVALTTTHLALREVADALSVEKISATAKRLHTYLQNFKKDPKIAVCALNPHASDNGLFGDEEEKIILPAVRQLLSEGLIIEGPLAADGLFHRSADYDGIVCMYHDQGLIPLKMRDFFEAVNISLGLPFLRVSVDHGTAFDLVGSKHVSSLSYRRSLEQALAWTKRCSQKN